MPINLTNFILTTFSDLFNYINPPLNNYSQFSQSLLQVIQVKPGENIQYNFDVEIDKLIKQSLLNHRITGAIFSEESGFFQNGNSNYRVVYDPFCNSSLASKSFREAAVGISIFSYDYQFLTSAIMDYQTGIVGIVENHHTHFYQIPTQSPLNLKPSSTTELNNAWTVLTLENIEERNQFTKVASIFNQTKRLIISSGHLYWLKLASGFIDAYLDPIGGEKLYEMFACTVAQAAGATVTNLKGEPFNPSQYLRQFETDPNFIYYPLAASTPTLHQQLLTSIL